MLKGVCAGTGYFSHFHLEAWSRIPEVSIVAVCDLDRKKAERVQRQYGVREAYSDFSRMLREERPDFVDIITTPDSHLELCQIAAQQDTAILCQKPFGQSLSEARQIVSAAAGRSVPVMVHENWRFQPWYREIKTLLTREAIGDKLHSVNLRSRFGDGWPADAYSDRQPYFREYSRFLIFESGVHFIDTLRYLGGEIERVYCTIRRLNSEIRGEDFCVMLFEFSSGAVGLWDANRYNESRAANFRLTFGRATVEGNAGSIRLYSDGRLTIQKLGEEEKEHAYRWDNRGFAGDSCYLTQRHFVNCLKKGKGFEVSGAEYLKTLVIREAAYRSAAGKRTETIDLP